MKGDNQLGNMYLDSVGSSVSGESRILEIELLGLADRLNLGYERKRDTKDHSKDFDLSKWKEGVAMNLEGRLEK